MRLIIGSWATSLVGAATLSLVAVGCSSKSDSAAPNAADTLCNKLTATCHVTSSTTGQPLTLSDCKASLKGVIFPSACAGALQSASCADLTAASSPAQDTCFPPCTTSGQTCEGDNGSVCSNGHKTTQTCASVCERDGHTYAGACGLTYLGNTSPTGGPVCWCK